MQLYVARQPIFDRERNIVAYELLYRNPTTKTAEQIDGDHATSSVLTKKKHSYILLKRYFAIIPLRFFQITI